jgi:hypothetical protein
MRLMALWSVLLLGEHLTSSTTAQMRSHTEGSGSSVFASLERSALRSLPAERFDMSQWSRARVNIDYHIAFDGNFYSVPYTLVQELRCPCERSLRWSVWRALPSL